MDRGGEGAKLSAFIVNSVVCTDYTPDLGLQREQTDEEVRTHVNLFVLPLSWIMAEQGTMDKLFGFLRENMHQLQGSLLLDAIFLVFWSSQ